MRIKANNLTKPWICRNCQDWPECEGSFWKYCLYNQRETVEHLHQAILDELDHKIRERQIRGDHFHAEKIIKFKEAFLIKHSR